jgi:hypothetical protein
MCEGGGHLIQPLFAAAQLGALSAEPLIPPPVGWLTDALPPATGAYPSPRLPSGVDDFGRVCRGTYRPSERGKFRKVFSPLPFYVVVRHNPRTLQPVPFAQLLRLLAAGVRFVGIGRGVRRPVDQEPAPTAPPGLVGCVAVPSPRPTVPRVRTGMGVRARTRTLPTSVLRPLALLFLAGLFPSPRFLLAASLLLPGALAPGAAGPPASRPVGALTAGVATELTLAAGIIRLLERNAAHAARAGHRPHGAHRNGRTVTRATPNALRTASNAL